jgi:hypothetical protein
MKDKSENKTKTNTSKDTFPFFQFLDPFGQTYFYAALPVYTSKIDLHDGDNIHCSREHFFYTF